MPSAKKVRWAQLKVGIMSAFALILVAVLIFLMTGERSFFASQATVYTFLDDSYAITPGAPVRLNGILIGKIANVGLSGEMAPNRIIKVSMEINREMLTAIPDDSRAAVSAENVLGSKYINIKIGRSATKLRPEGELPSLDTREFDEVVASGYDVMTSLRGILTRVDAIIGQVESGQGSIGMLISDEELYNNLNGTVVEARKFTQALNEGGGTVGRLLHDPSVYDRIDGTLARFDQIVEDLQNGQGTAGKLLRDPAVFDEARDAVAQLKQMLADLNAGKGTAGKLLKDEELHNKIAKVVDDLDTTMTKINTGEGTLGQLLVNPQLYESLNGASYEMHELMKDFRANPKKFLRIKLALF